MPNSRSDIVKWIIANGIDHIGGSLCYMQDHEIEQLAKVTLLWQAQEQLERSIEGDRNGNRDNNTS